MTTTGDSPCHSIRRRHWLRNVTTRSISPENFDGAKGGGGVTEGTGAYAARDLGPGWKISPSVIIGSGTTCPIATMDGPGVITHIWLTTHRDHWRTLVLRALGSRGGAGCRGPDRRLLRQRLGPVRSGELQHDRSLTRTAASTPTGRCPPTGRPAHRGEHRRCRCHRTTRSPTTDRDADGLGYLHAQFRRQNPLPVGSTHLGPHRRSRPLCRHLPRLGRQQPRLVGRGRAQDLPRRR